MIKSKGKDSTSKLNNHMNDAPYLSCFYVLKALNKHTNIYTLQRGSTKYMITDSKSTEHLN